MRIPSLVAAEPSAREGGAVSVGLRRRTLIAGAIGHFVEWYDWSIYGYLAAVFASQMFPSQSATASLIASFAVFAIGFIGRPVGAFVLSPLADRYGRRALLSATILMTGAGSLVIAVCPTYATVGVVAPIAIALARLLQGFSAGGEYQIAVTFLNEHASAKSRAFSSSPQSVALGLSVLFATAVASLTTGLLSPAALSSWGWRLPFALGALLSVVGIYLRSGIPESPSFQDVVGEFPAPTTALLASLASFPREIFVVFVMQLSSLMYYFWMIYLPTYATLAGGLDRTVGFVGSIVSAVIFCIAVPLFAAVSDRIGRRPFLLAAAVGFFLSVYPMLRWLEVPGTNFWRYLLVAISGTLLVALNNAVLGTVFAELFPTRIRASGIGIPYAICAAIFGGTAPMVSTWLQVHGGALFISAYIMAVCAISIAVHIWITPETFKRTLD